MRCQLRDLSLLRPQEAKAAVHNLATSLAKENFEPTTVRLLARLLIDSREPDTAIMLLRRAQQQHPYDYRIAFALAQEFYFDSFDADEAIKYYTVAVSLRADSALAHNHLGNLLRDKKHLDAARFHLEEAARLAPDSSFALCSLGVLYMERGSVDEALSCQRKAIHLMSPMSESGPSDDMYLLKKMGLLDQSTAAWKKIAILDSQDETAYKFLANAYHAKDECNEAAACYRKALDLAPMDASLHVGLAHVLQNVQLYDDAVSHNRRSNSTETNFCKGLSEFGHRFLVSGHVRRGHSSI